MTKVGDNNISLKHTLGAKYLSGCKDMIWLSIYVDSSKYELSYFMMAYYVLCDFICKKNLKTCMFGICM